MSIVLRIDDFPGTKPEEFDRHNLENFKKFDQVLADAGVPEYILGVIPRHTTDEQLMWLSENPRIRIAMHGITHDEMFPNEFRDFYTEKDVAFICSKGKERLARYGKTVEIYMPPHNVFDARTVRALKQAGFKYITGGPESPEIPVVELEYLYSSFPKEYGRSDELLQRGSVEHLRGSKDRVVLTLHWTWEFNIGLDNLKRYLEAIGPDNFVSL